MRRWLHNKKKKKGERIKIEKKKEIKGEIKKATREKKSRKEQ